MFAVYNTRAHLYTEVLGDIKIGEFGINIGVNDRYEVYTDETEYAEVALAAVVVFTVFEHAL
jgi:hypothetical protein